MKNISDLIFGALVAWCLGERVNLDIFRFKAKFGSCSLVTSIDHKYGEFFSTVGGCLLDELAGRLVKNLSFLCAILANVPRNV